MKKLAVLFLLPVFALFFAGCEIIEEEIERAESIELEDYGVDVANQDVYLKITSDADEQIIEEVEVNDELYELENVGDDWYLLDEVPIAESYEIDDLHYRTAVGAGLTFSIDYEITIDEAIDRAPEEYFETLEGTLEKDGYTFTESEEDLVDIESDAAFDVIELETWAWLITEDEEKPLFGIIEHEDTVYIFEAPEDEIEDYIK